jgi:MoxR-like ATPase
MDGFKNYSAKPVFVLAATNYTVEQSSARSLDAALLRRFDRRLLVD